MDYWLADGYLEYVSLDSTRGHVPLEALDLQATVTENSRHGLPFVLRSAPTDTQRNTVLQSRDSAIYASGSRFESFNPNDPPLKDEQNKTVSSRRTGKLD